MSQLKTTRLVTSVKFNADTQHNTFHIFADEHQKELLHFNMVDEDKEADKECVTAYSFLTLDEAEYLANRILDAVKYQREQIKEK